MTPEKKAEYGKLAAEAALEWALDEIDVLSNMLVERAYPQGMAMVGREDQFDSYRAACIARRLHRRPAALTETITKGHDS